MLRHDKSRPIKNRGLLTTFINYYDIYICIRASITSTVQIRAAFSSDAYRIGRWAGTSYRDSVVRHISA